MEEFVWGLQLDEEAHKPDDRDVFMDEDEVPKSSAQERKDEAGGWMEVIDNDKDEDLINEEKEEIVPDETIHEAPVGKGLSGALKLLKERGTLKETVDLGGRNMDKKKSKLVGIYDNDGHKEIRIERTDEFGRIMTPKEAFRMISHKFHGKGPGKTKQEKRMKQFQEELKLKQMKNSDTPSLSVERMREAQSRLKTPYLVLSGNVKPGQTSDPRSGFATVEKDLPGGLTPMLGDKKVEHFLGIKRKAEPGDEGASKKMKN
ncbi:SART-1 family protein DOT2-like [Macadamia integrifolia]|uniref:SART-1 family protein DOT2-like n=1 Tax=Macadamia integrifolia TaxID=60698 RepID=UPI001C4E31D6|nr:SART-1 family protein DOT2-like [Macadamia integrifolia]